MLLQIVLNISNVASIFLRYLPIRLQIKLQSLGRGWLIKLIPSSKFNQTHIINYQHTEQILWRLKFNNPLMNSAGIFKNGEGYNFSASIGAGGYIGGTSTPEKRIGNTIDNINLPFFSNSSVAINCLGIPNLGDSFLSKQTFQKSDGCPVGWSINRCYIYNKAQVLDSLWMYHNNLAIDFLEINESCPNMKQTDENIDSRLKYMYDNFLSKRLRHLPVVVKFSNDITDGYLSYILKLLVFYKFDGIVLGNTSTNYIKYKTNDNVFDYFTKKIGGGISGNVLKASSLHLCKVAMYQLSMIRPNFEFQVIRCGGINGFEDILASQKIGIKMNQWCTGFFSNYMKHGCNVYRNILSSN